MDDNYGSTKVEVSIAMGCPHSWMLKKRGETPTKIRMI